MPQEHLVTRILQGAQTVAEAADRAQSLYDIGSSAYQTWQAYKNSGKKMANPVKNVSAMKYKGRSRATWAYNPGRYFAHKDAVARRGGYVGRFQGAKELKFFDKAVAAHTVPNTANIASSTICDMAAGTGESNRVGRQIYVKKIFLKGIACIQPANNVKISFNSHFRIILYVDHQANGATANGLQILENDAVTSFRNLENSLRFTILSDKIYEFNNPNPYWNNTSGTLEGTSDETYFTISHMFKKPLKISYADVTAGISNIKTNNIGIACISTLNTGVTISYHTRIRFHD